MPQIEDLKSALMRNDSEGFLRCYLELITQGCTLSVPTGTTIEKVSRQWQDCIPKNCGTVDVGLLKKISEDWIALLADFGAAPSKDVAGSLLQLLNHKIQRHSQQEKASTLPDPSLSQVASQISRDYQNDQKARQVPIKSYEAVLTDIKVAVKGQDVDAFLLSYLALVHTPKPPKLPLNTMLDQIKVNWEKVLLTRFNLTPKPLFLDQLSSRWFNLVQRRGVPISESDIKELLFFYRKILPELTPFPKVKAPAKPKKKGPMWQRLKGFMA